MNAILPILAAVLQASSFTLDKIILSVRHVGHRAYVGISFPLIFLITLAIFAIVRPPLSFDLFAGGLGWLITASVAMTIATNLFFYRALDADALGEIQTLELLPAIPVILFSGVIFTDERRLAILIPALVAAMVIVWAHWERRHVRIAKRTLPFLLWALAVAPIGAAISKTLLSVWNPISLELVRSGAVAAVLAPFYSRWSRGIPLQAFRLLLLTNVLTTIAWILFYFSYQRSGIIYTLLLFSIQPVLVYFASAVLLRERLQGKKVVAFGVVLVSIAVAQFLV